MARLHLVLMAWPQLADTTIPPKLYNPVALNINTAHTPYNADTVNLRLRPIYGYGQSMVRANLWLRSIYGYGQSAVTTNLWLRPLYFVTTASLSITVLLYLDYMHYQGATLV